jgi:outer membrane protein assembly factor BamB
MNAHTKPLARIARVGVAAALLLTLAACDTRDWLQPASDAAHRRWNPGAKTLTAANVGSLQRAWHTDGPTGAFVVARSVYGVSSSTLYSLDLATGAIQWAKTPSAPITGGPFVDSVDSIRISYGSAVGDGFETTFDRNGASPSDEGDDHAEAIQGALVARDAGRSVRVRASGTPFTPGWIDVSGTPLRGSFSPAAFAARATVGPSRVYVPQAFNGHSFVVGAYDPSRACSTDVCEPVWLSDYVGNGDVTVSPDGSTLYVPSSEPVFAVMTALDAATGTKRWSLPGLDGGVASDDSSVFVAGGDGFAVPSLRALDPATGATKWSAPLSDQMTGGPGAVAVGASVVFAAFGSEVRAYDADGCGSATCPPLWSAQVDSAVSSIVLARGRVFVGTDTGVTAFRLPL